MIEHNLNKVDTRISELHTQLAKIMTKIDSLATTIAFSRRDSSAPSTSIPSSSSSCEFGADEIDDILTSSFRARADAADRKYSLSFVGQPPVESAPNIRNTCIGNEHEF